MILPLNIYRFLSSPEDYLSKLQKKHGDPFPLSLPGAPTILLTGKSEFAKLVFTAPSDSFKTSEKNPVGPLLGPNGLIMQSGQRHLCQRKEFVPYFSKKNLVSFSSDIMEIFFSIYQSHNHSGVLVAQDYARKLALKIILKFLFPHLSLREMDEAEVLTENFLNSYSASFLFVPSWVPGTWKNFNQKKKELDHRFFEFFISGLSSGIDGPLNRLEGSSVADVLDHIRTFIVAGHETSATSLSWALYHLHKNSYIKNRLCEELAIFKNLSKDNYLEQVLNNQFIDLIVQETLRIQSPVPFITRKIINRNFHLGDQQLKIDDELGVCITLLHKQDEIWTNPFEFKPDRFLEKKYSAYEYAPFGGGTRKCIGSELALLELKILIGFFIRYYQAELAITNIPKAEVLQITIGPSKPILLSYSKNT